MEVHFFFSSFLFCSFCGRREDREKGQSGLCLAPFLDEGIVTMPPVSACSSSGDGGNGHFHGFSGHCQWSSHSGCTLNLSLLTQGHRENAVLSSPRNVLSC